MKIQIDHIVRDMTAEEEAAYLAQENEPTIEDKAEAYDILIGGETE